MVEEPESQKRMSIIEAWRTVAGTSERESTRLAVEAELAYQQELLARYEHEYAGMDPYSDHEALAAYGFTIDKAKRSVDVLEILRRQLSVES